MSNSSQRRRDFKGPVFYSHGFRPFFLFAGVWAALAMLVWILYLATGTEFPTRMDPVDWHMHEMVFGYSSAVIAGFLLTAVPNWTGRMPIIGWPTAMLSGLWALGRIALFFSVYLPIGVAPVIDAAFLVVFVVVIGREIVSGNNWRNLKVLVLVSLLALANIGYHIESNLYGAFGGYAIRVGVGVVILMIMVIGGRVIPSFTRNWLVRQGPGRLPTPFNGFDKGLLGGSAAVILLWILLPESPVTRIVAGLATLGHLVRLIRWTPWRTFSEPLVTILHVGYLFVPVGFATLAANHGPMVPHAWGAGAIGVVTLAMMTRASLGHSGRPLTAKWPLTLVYVLVVTAVLSRMLAEVLPGVTGLLHLSATAWIAGFGLYAIVYFPIFTRPRLK